LFIVKLSEAVSTVRKWNGVCWLSIISWKDINGIFARVPEGTILSYVFTTANQNDAIMAVEILYLYKKRNIEVALSNAAYDSENIRKVMK